jgi:para-aminobenzoate synthetase/4-amino-4-deoxychorismate lyase
LFDRISRLEGLEVIRMSGLVLLQDCSGARWLRFENPLRVFQTTEIDEVLPLIKEVEQQVNERNLYAAGFISYEAAPAFDRALVVKNAGLIPLIWFGLYSRPQEYKFSRKPSDYSISSWNTSVDWQEYQPSIAQVKEHIAAGDTYQVNYTLRLRSKFSGDPWGLFLDLIMAQQSDYAAYLDTGPFAICSASPELFFQLDGHDLIARPMKGTNDRGRTLNEDKEKAIWLQKSEKNRAENVMIVDMIRNDLGRVCDIGSVEVTRLFDVERYPTLWQMTSTVRGKTSASFVDVLKALFPCASITGAPKVRTMQIISNLETKPRGLYTGSIGYLAPGRQAQFNVAIRTVQINLTNGRAEYGVGGGIVWDSGASGEYFECQTKARILFDKQPEFRLLETLLWNPTDGYLLLEEHLQRMFDSAEYFGFRIDLDLVQRRLFETSDYLEEQPYRIRLLLNRDGSIELEKTLLEVTINEVKTVRLALEPVNPENIFLYHKTTNRQVYEQARVGHEDCDDVILWNDRGELTEATTANIVMRLDDQLVTPPVASGLLAGTYRAKLLADGEIRERTLLLDDLNNCDELYLVNSVRKWSKAQILLLSKI